MLVGKTERRSIPHEPDEWFEFRCLSGAELDEAEQMTLSRMLSLVKGFDASSMQAIRGQSGQDDADQSGGGYDKDTLVRYGVAAWSYPEPCTDDNKRRLDAATRNWAAGVVEVMNTLGEGSGSVGSFAAAESPRNSGKPSDSGGQV